MVKVDMAKGKKDPSYDFWSQITFPLISLFFILITIVLLVGNRSSKQDIRKYAAPPGCLQYTNQADCDYRGCIDQTSKCYWHYRFGECKKALDKTCEGI